MLPISESKSMSRPVGLTLRAHFTSKIGNANLIATPDATEMLISSRSCPIDKVSIAVTSQPTAFSSAHQRASKMTNYGSCTCTVKCTENTAVQGIESFASILDQVFYVQLIEQIHRASRHVAPAVLTRDRIASCASNVCRIALHFTQPSLLPVPERPTRCDIEQSQRLICRLEARHASIILVWLAF